jgi:hypothetical protein
VSKALAVYAGHTALAQIQEQGISQEQIQMMIGASGGPKWFVLAGLDRYFCGDFFKDRTAPIYTLGSSAGAWRFACYAQQDPLAAINRLIHGYSHMSYPEKATIKQVSEQSEQLLTHILGSAKGTDIIQNPIFKSNIVVAKSLGLTRFEHKSLQLPGLLASAIGNRVKRQHLGKFYQRMVFSADVNNIPFDYNDGINTSVVAFEQKNYQLALQATGAIPLIINGVKDIPSAGAGMYRDGGIVDYHFDQQFLPAAQMPSLAAQPQSGLVLYPHFYNEFKPGWFDKYIKGRVAAKQHFDNVVVLAPTAEFVARLTFGKIPDRKDFTQLSEAARIKYWQTVVSESERLADEFNELVHSSNPAQHIQLIS